MTKEELNEYLNLLDKFNDRSMDGSLEEKNQIEKFNSLYHSNEEHKLLIDRLKVLQDKEEQNRIIDEYLMTKKGENEKYVSFDKIYDYQENLEKLSKIQIECLRYLIFEKNKYNLQYVNLEKLIAVDDKGKIYEAKYDEHLNKIIIYSEQEKTLSDGNIDKKEDAMNVFENNSKIIVENSYDENNDYSAEDSYQRRNMKQKVKTKSKFNTAYGFISAGILSLFAGFFGGMFTTIVIGIIKIKSIY